ncbi:MAG: hypothetical protein JWQ64_375 [Subtercola sp.]|nr:hypothetical protein [Subtercola sp.]
MSDTPESETENVVGDDSVTIHRAPRYFRFMIAGAVAGLIVALILTFAFPEPEGFDFSQVFGFLALFFIVFGFAVGAIVALLIDRGSRRAARTISMERVEGGDAEGREQAPDAPADSVATRPMAPADDQPTTR